MAEGRKTRSSGRSRSKRKDEDEFGTGDKARDGEPNGGTGEGGMSAEDDDLARKRREKAEADAAAAAKSDADAAKAAGGNGDALADADVDAEQPQEELFPVGSLEGDPKMTLAKLIKPNHKVEYTVSLMSAEVPLRGGLIDPDTDGHVMITYEVASVTPVPIREDRGGVKKLVGWKIRQQLRPTYVEPIEASKPNAAAG